MLLDDRRFHPLSTTPPPEWPMPATRVVVPTRHEPNEAWDAQPDGVPS